MLLLATTISRLIDRWHTADATEYGVLSLSIVVLGWFISKYYVD